GLVFAARRTRGPLRLTLRLAAIWIFFPALISICFVALVRVGHSSLDTALGVGGILVSFFFGWFGPPSTIFDSEAPTVAVIIASKGTCHREVRRGLQEQLERCNARVTDLGNEAIFSREDETAFLRIFRRASASLPDYLVIWAPGSDWTSE